MLNGDNFKRPDITSTSVKKAFQTLTYTPQDDSDGITLKTLALVDKFLDSPHCPSAENLRQYALAEILTDIVIRQLANTRQLFNLPAPDSHDSLSAVHDQIIEDSAGSPQLIGWSFMYYHYIRNELDISQERYSEISHTVKRTLRRYIQHTLEAIANILIEKEWSVRQEQHQQNLRQAIPVAQRASITSRQRELYVLGSLLSDDEAKCVLVTGLAGCGKTTLVGQSLHQMITDNAPDYVLWFDFFESVEDVYQKLLKVTHLHQENQVMKLLMSNRVIIAIDNLDSSNLNQIQQLVRLLRNTICILMSQESVMLPDITHRIHLQPLSETMVIDMATQMLPAVNRTVIEKQVKHIYQTIEQTGDLNAIRSFLMGKREISDSDFYIESTESKNSSNQSINTNLSDIASSLWWLLSHIESEKSLKRYVYHDISVHLPGAMQELYESSILIHQNDILLLAVNIQAHYHSSDDIPYVLNIFRQQQQPFLMLATLMAGEKQVTLSVLKETIIYCWQNRDMMQHSDVIWRRVFDVFNQLVIDDARLLLILAQYFLSEQDMEAAYQTLQSAIFTAGHCGEFLLQIEAQLALASFYRRTSRYVQAQEILETVKKALGRYDNPELSKIYTMEKIQLVFETSSFMVNDEIEWGVLNHSDDTIKNVLMAEYYLSEDETSYCRQFAEAVLYRDDLSHEDKMAVWTVTGRSYIRDGQVERGIDWLNAVVSIVEQSSNKVSTARAQTNLAAALLLLCTEASCYEAEMLLRQAEATQQAVEDTVGLNVTYHNLDILHKLRTQT